MSEEKQKGPSPQEQARTLRGWIAPKEVQIRQVQKSIEAQELYSKQLKEDLASGFYIKNKKKEIAEQMTSGAKKMKELELEMLEKELESGFLTKQSEIIMEDLKVKLTMEENALKDIKKKITMAERNHKVEVKGEKKDG